MAATRLMSDNAAFIAISRYRDKLPPLLEQEWHAGGFALVAQISRPIGMHRPCAGPTLAASDDPVEPAPAARALQVDGAEKWLGRYPV